MNAITIEELIEKGNTFTIHLCGHTDPIKIDKSRNKPVVDRKKKVLTFTIPDSMYVSREFIVDISHITHIEYYRYN